MEHKGLRYELLQSVAPVGWKWVVYVGVTTTTTGFSFSKDLAKIAAIKAIDKIFDEQTQAGPISKR
jgi:hypothetical protein